MGINGPVALFGAVVTECATAPPEADAGDVREPCFRPGRLGSGSRGSKGGVNHSALSGMGEPFL